jgi:hypothetical protein
VFFNPAQVLLGSSDQEDTMKKLLGMTTVVVCAVLFLGTWSTTAAQGQKKPKKSGGGAITISGCLQKGPEANTYVLANVAGGGPYELIGAPASFNFAAHVGHRIEVIGKNVTKPNKAAKIEGTRGAAKKEERGERHLEVQSMKMVSPSCP